MTETDPLRDVLDRVLSRMHHSMKRLSYRLRSEVDSPEVREIVDEYLGEIAYESEVIAFYMAEYPPLNTHTEYGVQFGLPEPIICDSEQRALQVMEDSGGSAVLTRQVTDWAPAKNLSPSPGHAKKRAETLHVEEA